MMKAGGFSYVSSPPAFSNDSTKLLICTGNSVSIFSTSTGLLVNELQGHGSQVTSVLVVPAASGPASKILCYCWTASLDGTIRHWDFSVPELLKTIDIRHPVHSMVIPGLLNQSLNLSSQERPDLFAYLCTEEVKPLEPSSWAIRKCNLTRSRFYGGVVLAETPNPKIISVSPAGDFIGISENRHLRIWKIPCPDSANVKFQTTRLHHTRDLTTLAFHPSERMVAAGDSTGRILIWRDVGKCTFAAADPTKLSARALLRDAEENPPGVRRGDPTKLSARGLSRDTEENPGVRPGDDADSCTTWHWHATQVNFLFFSSDGACLYSGGNEGVLVLWQLDTGKKRFLPRIRSPLLYLTNSSDPSLSCISCADNVVHLLKMPALDIMRSVSGIKPRQSALELSNDSCGVVFNNSNGLVAVCTESYCVQFYSLIHDREVSQVQICERNHQPGDEITVVVNLVALSSDGTIMSTVETRLPEDGIGGLVCLKLWDRGPESKDFSLSTVVYEPHREAGISDIAFHPSQKMVVSCSFGAADFKVWVGRSDAPKEKTRQSKGWTCHAVGSYKYKPLTAATFSADGSVLAVAAERVITLWDPVRNFLVAVIGDTLEPITTLSFVGKSEYLVSTSRGSNPQVSVWSTSNLSISWSYKLRAEGISCATDGSSFAVLALVPPSSKNTELGSVKLHKKDGAILIFNVENPVPVSTWFVRKAQGGGLGFVQTTCDLDEDGVDEKSSEVLAYMNCNHEYMLLDTHNDQPKGKLARPLEVAESTEREKFGYASIYGELAVLEVRNSGKQNVTAPFERPWETIFSGPSHVLPDLTKLCSNFLESLLERRSKAID